MSASIDRKFLEILVCPICKGPLTYKRQESELVCKADGLAFPVTEDGVPCLIEEDARKLSAEDDKD